LPRISRIDADFLASRTRLLIMPLRPGALALLGLALALGGLSPSPTSAPAVRAAADRAIYGDALAAGWQNWSWNTGVNFAAASPVHAGSHAIAVTYQQAWAGFYLHLDGGVDAGAYTHLRFWIHGGAGGSRQLQVAANGDGAHTAPVTAAAGAWTEVNLPLSQLGGPATLDGLWWQDASGGAQPTFYLDDVSLVAGGAPPPALTLSVDAAADRKPISPLIYGMNFADEALAAELDLPVNRWGGNSTTRYNWQNDTYNTASDWFFQNIPNPNADVAALPNGSAADRFVEQNKRTGTESLITVPLIGWVAKRRPPNDTHPYDCGFSIAKYGPQQANDWEWDPDCGDGLQPNGAPITGNDPTDTSVTAGPGFVAGWVQHLVGRFGSAAAGGVRFYNLDNEPMLWNSTHRDIHPQPVTYAELRDRTVQYAAALKAADPAALTLGPVLWGWCAYFYSAADGCAPGAEFQRDGAFTPWYLGQMQAYEQANGVRLLDYLDLHYYPQADGVSLSPAGDAATQARRLRSTRSLWDPAYTDESWIAQAGPDGGTVRLIPRMREWAAAHYPGTRLAITEYNWGGLEHLNGALAQAEVLGVFGREGLDLATLWAPPEAGQPGAFAFRMYRNYDGNGGRFGDVSVRAVSSQPDTLSIYAAQRTSDGALTVIVINKSGGDRAVDLALAGFAPAAPAQVYRYSAANLNAIVRGADLPADSLSAIFPANAITLLVIPGQSLPAADHSLFLPLIQQGHRP